MLTIIFGVATFLCYRQYSDTAKSLKAAQDDATRKQRDGDKARDDANKLKQYLGVAETENIEDLSKQFDEDMKKYGSAYSQEVQFYRPLVEKFYQSIQQKDKDLVALKDENLQLKDKYELREASKDAQLKQFDETVNRVTQDLNARTETYRKERDRLTEDQNRIKEQLQNARKESATATSKSDAKYQELAAQLQKTRQVARKLREENTVLTNPVMDTPDGEIRWVNQRNGTVWIDVGREDHLNPLMTFAVYPADITNLGTGAKKAGIEVTQILGDHLAEARILEDDISDPIMPGDKIHTPIWSPGDQRHFALAGFMDVNGDGINDIQLLRNLISINGGVIDCEIDEKGKKIGDISLKTRYLVLGDKPGEKGQPGSLTGYTSMISEAENLGIPKISLSELLQRIGYKPQSHVVTFGRGANPSDFKPQPDTNAPRYPTGSVSDLYKTREPARSGSSGAY